jgi:hypothetical protein
MSRLHDRYRAGGVENKRAVVGPKTSDYFAGLSASPLIAAELMQRWSVGDAIYFTFVTGLTIAYGDIVPRQALARVLAIGIGVSGLFLTGLIAGIAVYAMRTALTDRDAG